MVASNTFIRSGDVSFYYEEFRNQEWAVDSGDERECASYGNRFDYNHLLSDYDGDNSSESWWLKPWGQTYSGEAPCSIPDDEQRLRTVGNTTE
jgi:hypothetical protein